ncbi:hypothetical protein LCGC14_0846100 [marine sediment metagenome]|uniref:HEPN domain-containing protein n=1 Tax=marine sediment metagenome TaxID=412755 RepID=A0A0F9PBL2_9ZZZZ
MDLKKWQNGLKLYLKNAEQLRDDGEILMEKSSYGHAYFSFYTALEEVGMALYILDNFRESKPEEMQNFIKSSGSHKRKSKIMIFDSFTEKIKDLNLSDDEEKEMIKTGESIEDFYARKLDEKLGFWEKRNRGIYVSLNRKKNDWLIPQNMTLRI